jgi:hypothetical protein
LGMPAEPSLQSHPALHSPGGRLDIALRSLIEKLLLQIVEGFFRGLNDLVPLLGIFIAYKYANGKNYNQYKHRESSFLIRVLSGAFAQMIVRLGSSNSSQVCQDFLGNRAHGGLK